MERHLHLVPSGADLLDVEEVDTPPTASETPETNVVDLETERQRRRSYRYHPAAGMNWLDDLFDDDDLDPVC